MGEKKIKINNNNNNINNNIINNNMWRQFNEMWAIIKKIMNSC